MANKTLQIGECSITLTKNWRFHVAELDKDYPSLEEAREAIERAAKRIESAKKVKVDLPCIDASGTPRRITGVHAGNCNLLVTPKFNRYSEENLHPDVDWIKQAIAEKDRLHAEWRRHEDLVEKFAIVTSGYRSHWTPESIIAVHAKLDAKAKATTYEAELAKIEA